MIQTSPIKLSARVQRVKPSPTLAVANHADALIAAGKPIINLGIGEPDFDTPAFIKKAAIAAIEAGRTKYTPVDGTVALKQAIIDKLARENNLTYQPNQIIVSCGAKHSLFNLFMAILEAGDEVIIPAPFWVSYPDIVKLADATPVIVATTSDQQFKLMPEQLNNAITQNTRLLVLNSPSNPSGMAYSKAELAALGKILQSHPQVAVVTDDIYEHTLWNHLPFANILNACPDLYERTIVINGVSKAYAMTGWRIGYAAGPQAVVAAMKKVQSQSTSNPSSISQAASTAALNGDQSCIATMTQAYKERHDYLLHALEKIPGFVCMPTDGTFYTFPNIAALLAPASSLKDDVEFSEYLLNEAEVAVIPGSAFGTAGHIRLSYATSMENLKLAVSRIDAAVKKLLGK